MRTVLRTHFFLPNSSCLTEKKSALCSLSENVEHGSEEGDQSDAHAGGRTGGGRGNSSLAAGVWHIVLQSGNEVGEVSCALGVHEGDHIGACLLNDNVASGGVGAEGGVARGVESDTHVDHTRNVDLDSGRILAL